MKQESPVFRHGEYQGYEISLELEGDVIDTVVVPVLESNLGEEHDLL